MRYFRNAVLVLGLATAFILFAKAGVAEIYSETANAAVDIHNALLRAKREHKRVILIFGGNWCGDCQVLDIYLHDPSNSSILNASFILVHVNIGRYDKNLDIADKYQIPLKKGVPALAVLDERGTLLNSQHTGEFEKMQGLTTNSVTTFLVKWKSAGPCSVIVKC
jgi:thiol-disulfide isomerase/thioredoxin